MKARPATHPQEEDRFPKRKHPRLKEYDYTSEGCYFLTICTHGKTCLFGMPQQKNIFRQIAEQGILIIPEHYPGIRIEKAVVMPNHVHILLYQMDHSVGIPNIIGSYKSYVSRQIHQIWPDIQVWQSSFHDHVVRNEKSFQHIWGYIDTNPIRWEKDCFFVPQP